MTNRERFLRVMNFQPVDRMPMIEWAPWWDKTLARWHNEGLPAEVTDLTEIRAWFGLDLFAQHWISSVGVNCPPPAEGRPRVVTEDDYQALLPYLYPETPLFDPDQARTWAAEQASGDKFVWVACNGFFWWPRVLFGIEPHLFAFYDQPELMHRMNEDLLRYNLRALEALCEICVPDIVLFAEDMSYNHGPMISAALFDEFIAPYYRRMTPPVLERGLLVGVDSDGDVTDLVPWMTRVGVQLLLPLERMAGVDVNELRWNHPDLRMIGAFDKTVMHRGEAAIRGEFERLLFAMRSGGFIASVDHQTPPGVSLEDYRLYLRLLREYAAGVGTLA